MVSVSSTTIGLSGSGSAMKGGLLASGSSGSIGGATMHAEAHPMTTTSKGSSKGSRAGCHAGRPTRRAPMKGCTLRATGKCPLGPRSWARPRRSL